ncbi:hypothetical protein PG995_003428 [Apiospora arundinis]|uniref:MLX-interacting protein n=1 Tax=Apiospora arundinis TaxID=335852 RepID=A0ABR2HS58_9PEZI
MADKSSHSPSPGLNGQGDEKPRLTEEEKKQNHIASEQKRRQAIRDGFDRLCELVPGLEGQGRSEGLVLKRTVEYMREQLERRRQLVREKEARGEYVDDKMKEPVAILERLEERDRQRAAARGTNEDDDELS